jgi:CheY-like chemotaxis protein
MPRVLYIDDDRANRMLVRRILLAYDFEVDEADSASKGIEMATANPPDIILMDMSMPEMDGLTATQRIRSIPALQKVPVVIVTANVMQVHKEQSLNAGSDGFIGKPIDIDKFPDQVNDFIKRSRTS